MIKGIIVRVVGGLFYVLSEDSLFKCRASGKLRDFNLIPVAGDEIMFEKTNKNEGYIKQILPRKNKLLRPPVANVDQAIVVMSLTQPVYSSLLLDKFLLQIIDNEIKPVIYFSKKDLVDDLDYFKEQTKVYEDHGFKIYFANSLVPDNDKIFYEILSNKKSVLTGQSGAGKSAFLNSLSKDLKIKTGEYSPSLGRGRHTTREVEFLHVYDGLLADTPGFSSLSLNIDPKRVATIYPCFADYSLKCKFRGCLHQQEPGCSVKQAIEDGLLTQDIYENYLKILEEVKAVYNKKW